MNQLTLLSILQFHQAFFYIYVHQDDVNSDLFDITAADHILMVPAKNTPYLTGAGYNNMCYMAGADIELNITDIP